MSQGFRRPRLVITKNMENTENKKLETPQTDPNLNAKYALAISALEVIVDPMRHIRGQIKEGEILNPMWAILLMEKPQFYQGIAGDALKKIHELDIQK